MITIRPLVFSVILLALSLAACDRVSPSADPQVGLVTAADALCRPTATGRQVTGCYLTLTASRDDTLMSVESDASALGQVHENRMESNMMTMRQLNEGLPLPAGQAVTLLPGGNHIMLLGVKEPLAAGDTVPLTLTFANAAPVEITATVGQPVAAGAGSDHAGH